MVNMGRKNKFHLVLLILGLAVRATHPEDLTQSVLLRKVRRRLREQRQNHQHQEDSNDDLSGVAIAERLTEFRGVGLALEERLKPFLLVLFLFFVVALLVFLLL